jgi:hypothetical protein
MKRLLSVFVVIYLASAASAAWYTNTGDQTLAWLYRQKITVNSSSVDADLSNFPVLVNITDVTNPIFSKAQTDGDDILFTSSDENTKLNHEIEQYNSSAGTLCAWVNVTSLADLTDTVIYMYYGCSNAATQENKTGAWDANYQAVWHLKEDPSNHSTGFIKDSTANANNGSTEASMTSDDQVSGQIDGAIDFDGSNDSIAGIPKSLMQISPESIEIWFKTRSTAVSHLIWAGQNTGNGWGQNPEYHISLGAYIGAANSNYVSAYFGDASNRQNDAGTFTGDPLFMKVAFTDTSEAHQVVLTNTGTSGILYLDGVQVSADASAVINSTTSWNAGTLIGRCGANSRFFNGIIDEIRISNMVRSAPWISTGYKNQHLPSGFYTIAAEERRPAAILIE